MPWPSHVGFRMLYQRMETTLVKSLHSLYIRFFCFFITVGKFRFLLNYLLSLFSFSFIFKSDLMLCMASINCPINVLVQTHKCKVLVGSPNILLWLGQNHQIYEAERFVLILCTVYSFFLISLRMRKFRHHNLREFGQNLGKPILFKFVILMFRNKTCKQYKEINNAITCDGLLKTDNTNHKKAKKTAIKQRKPDCAHENSKS